LRRCDWALMALPETLKMENMDMVGSYSWRCVDYWPVMALSMVLDEPFRKRSVAS
jgi:hypothetical protein